MTNRLADESSPYLLQHAGNPVEWYPWGEEAFARARADERPVFLSIGYSTCHWCHVMERESFEDEAVAELLNRHFVAIKVDREERPDVDRVYMAFVQATTGAGGWPMSVWLTPELKPFFGGTYFPPASRWGRPGFADVLRNVAHLWAERRPELVQSAETLVQRLAEQQRAASAGAPDGGAVAGADTLAGGVGQFEQAFDAAHGGFGGAPKFPRPAELLFLLREHARGGGRRPLEMAAATLRAMARGGLNDHLGGGFHRYAVDAQWRIPHFEKMLYDQAQLTLAFLEAGQAARDPECLAVADEVLGYVRRDLAGPGGAFFSAEDADSLEPGREASGPHPEKREGAFYLWTGSELDELLGDDAETFRLRYGVEDAGNAVQDPTGEFQGLNQLYLAQSPEEVSRRTERPPGDVRAAVERGRRRLLDVRAARPRPHLDDKVLTAWNGLMLAALARAAHVFEGRADSAGAAAALDAARRTAGFMRETMWDAGRGVLYRSFRGGRVSIPGYAEDYAFLTWGLLELFQTDGDPAWLRWALDLQARQDELFWDAQGGGWFSTTGTDPSVLLRLKEDYDGAEPSAGSVAAQNLLALVRLTGDGGMRRRLEAALGRFGSRLGQAARAIPLLASVLSSYHAGASQVVVVGERGRPDAAALRRVVAGRYLPFAVRLNVEPGSARDALGQLLPFVASMGMRDGRATAYVCTDFACREPVTDPQALAAQLDALEKGGA